MAATQASTLDQMVRDAKRRYRQYLETHHQQKPEFRPLLLEVVRSFGFKDEDVSPMCSRLSSAWRKERTRNRRHAA